MATAKASARRVTFSRAIQPREDKHDCDCLERIWICVEDVVIQPYPQLPEVGDARVCHGELSIKTVEWLLTGASAAHDEAMFGLRCVSKEGFGSDSKDTLIMTTFKRLPKHLLLETIACLPSTGLSAMLMILSGSIFRASVKSIPGFAGSIAWARWEFQLNGMVGEAFLSILTPILMTDVSTALLCASWMLPFALGRPFHILIKIYAPVQVMVQASVIMAKIFHPSQAGLIEIGSKIVYIGLLIAISLFPLQSVGRRTGNPVFAYCFCGSCLIGLIVSFGFIYGLPFILVASDFTKVMTIVVLIPVVFHALLNPVNRVIARAIRNIDASTLWIYTVLPPTGERAFTRLVMCTLSQPSIIVIAVLLKSALTTLFDLAFGDDDYRLYLGMGLLSGVASSVHNVYVPQKRLLSERHKTFRSLYTSSMFSIDFALISTFSAFLLAHNVGNQDGELISVGNVVAKFSIQIFCEYTRHISQIILLVKRSQVDYITLSSRKCQYSAFCLIPCVVYMVANLINAFIPMILCVAPSSSKADFLLCNA
eukprot:TRINITY_DN10081_c0_g1_i1.p1 TRINITY_DN10081_c0_g1~~TRINITY_DN10081_c0_g1_i1.p1  ORF type:complete len:538 (+),score=31.45 TRINITY_DN10081_c0_g1_i1:109-1722(+)